MKAIFALVVCGAAAAPLLSAAQEPEKLSCIKDVVYSQQFLAKYPRAPAGCREVELRDGQKWIRFEARVVKVDGNQMTADFIDNHDQTIATLTFQAGPNAMVQVDGRDTKYKNLKSGDDLTLWVPESRFGFYSNPKPSTQLTLINDGTAQR